MYELLTLCNYSWRESELRKKNELIIKLEQKDHATVLTWFFGNVLAEVKLMTKLLLKALLMLMNINY